MAAAITLKTSSQPQLPPLKRTPAGKSYMPTLTHHISPVILRGEAPFEFTCTRYPKPFMGIPTRLVWDSLPHSQRSSSRPEFSPCLQGNNDRVLVLAHQANTTQASVSLSDPQDRTVARGDFNPLCHWLIAAELSRNCIYCADSTVTMGDPNPLTVLERADQSQNFTETRAIPLPKTGKPVSYLHYDRSHNQIFVGMKNGIVCVQKNADRAPALPLDIVRDSPDPKRDCDLPILFLAVIGNNLIVVDCLHVETWNATTFVHQRSYHELQPFFWMQATQDDWTWSTVLPLPGIDFREIMYVESPQTEGTNLINELINGYLEDRYLNRNTYTSGVTLDYSTETLYVPRDTRYNASMVLKEKQKNNGFAINPAHQVDIFEKVTTALQPRRLVYQLPSHLGCIAASDGVLFVQQKGNADSTGSMVSAFDTRDGPKQSTEVPYTWPHIADIMAPLFHRMFAGSGVLVTCHQTEGVYVTALSQSHVGQAQMTRAKGAPTGS